MSEKSLLRPKPNKTTCPRCDKPCPYTVPTYWGGKFGRLCSKCCVLAAKHHDKTEWPPVPWDEVEVVLDGDAAQAAKQEGMDRVERNADPDWKRRAYEIVLKVAEQKPEFTPDDIWEAGLEKPAEARALGPVMATAARRRLIKKTDRVAPTRQEKSHGTDVAVWQSLIYGRN